MQSLALLLLLLPFCYATPYGGYDYETRVSPGQSIQKAIDDAKPDTTILVTKGEYSENLLIAKDGITLLGQEAVLVTPTSPVSNACTGLVGSNTTVGICVAGSDIQLGPFPGTEHRDVISFGKRVKGVTVSGFTVKNFDGASVAVLAAEDTRVKENKLINGGAYGFLSHASLTTVVTSNDVTSEAVLRFIGICTDDTSASKVEFNKVAGYGIGLCVQTNGALYNGNEVSNACAGVFVDPGISADIFYNHIRANNPNCLTTFGFVTGILVFGAVKSRMILNLVEDQKAGGAAAGLSVVDALQVSPPVVAADNIVFYNVLQNNDYDIFVNTTGSGNVVQPNWCSTPAALCGLSQPNAIVIGSKH